MDPKEEKAAGGLVARPVATLIRKTDEERSMLRVGFCTVHLVCLHKNYITTQGGG
jgi:hypothetical protein